MHIIHRACGCVQASADLQQEVPTDTQVLSLLAMVLKAAGQQKELAAIYAAASAARPRSSELLRGLFAAHVACGPRACSCAYSAASQWSKHGRHTVMTRASRVRRDFDFAKQQQVAMKLHRMGGLEAESCLWWAVASLVLQARAAPAGEHPSM